MIKRVATIVLMLGLATGAEAGPAKPAEVMLVGTYHLANNNRDLINLPIENVLTAKRQAEIDRLVDGLAQWRPTRVAIEWRRSDQAGLDRRYADYLAGRLTPSANERDQIAFRLAKKLGLSKLYAIDWNGDFPGSGSDYDFMDWAKRNGQQDRFDRFIKDGQADADRTAAAMRTQTVSQWYRALNAPGKRLKSHQAYFTIASFGTDDANPGAAWVGGWYARNLRIFNSLRPLATPGERVFVLYGAGHTHMLEGFLRESGAAKLVDGRTFMPRR